MDKQKKKSSIKWTWLDSALQLSVVSIGIMVTFIGSDLIGRWSRARQQKAVMQLVVSEPEATIAPIKQKYAIK